jgi:hypothetical protein
MKKYYANAVTSSPILVILMMEAILSYETSVLTRATWRNIPADSITVDTISEVTGPSII